MGEFSGQVALVTESSSGVGEAIARRLAALGASVVINSAHSVEAGSRIAAELGKEALYVRPTSATRPPASGCRPRRSNVSANSTSW